MPCTPNKERGKICMCDEYEKKGKRILIIKLDAMGDVLRTTPIVRKLRKDFKDCEVTWITKYPELASADIAMPYSTESVMRILADSFDISYNFDKCQNACALQNLVKAVKKKGFSLKDGKCHPIDRDAEHKFLTGIFDSVGIANTKSYVEEIFEIAGLKFEKEKYILKQTKKFRKKLKKPLIGLNTGSGSSWKARNWPVEHWIKLAKMLKKAGYNVVLLGGEKEHQTNKSIAVKTKANYFGYFSLENFIALMNECDIIITPVTLALHISIALEKRVILLNSVFNKNEFELYGLGETLEPPVKGKYYGQKPEEGNMDKLLPQKVFESATRMMKAK